MTLLLVRCWERIFMLRPSLPKYAVTYDPDIVLRYMDSVPNNSALMLEMLTKKVCLLLCSLSGQRRQIIASRSIDKLHLCLPSIENYKIQMSSKTFDILTFFFSKQKTVCSIVDSGISRRDLIRENLDCELKLS